MTATWLRAAAGLVVALSMLGCTTVTTGPTAAPSAQLTAGPSLSATVLPSLVTSAEPSLVSETTEPSKPTKPPKSPKPTQPTGPAVPNLIVTKFTTDEDRFVVDIHAQVRVTVKNDGTADAGPFDLGISFTDGVGGGGITPTSVDGLAAGDSIQLTIVISPLAAGNLTYTATADAGDSVAESNEDDNTGTLAIAVVDLPNIGFFDEPFKIVQLPGETGYRLQYNYKNLGDVTVETIFTISFDWSSINASGNFPADDCCGTSHGMHWGPGAETLSNNGPFNFPTGGDYTVTVTLDSANVVEESDETDNKQSAQVTVPYN
jgi:hypothetical protein